MVRCTRYNCSSVSDVVPIGGFLRFPPPNSIDRHDIAEILLKVVLSAIVLTLTHISHCVCKIEPEVISLISILGVITYVPWFSSLK